MSKEDAYTQFQLELMEEKPVYRKHLQTVAALSVSQKEKLDVEDLKEKIIKVSQKGECEEYFGNFALSR